MSRPAEKLSTIGQTNPDEAPIDGTKGGALDPDDMNNNEPGGGVAVPPKPSPDINKKIAAAVSKIDTLKKQRSEINSKISAEIEAVEALGINRHAFRHAMRYAEMSPEQRQGLDLSYATTRAAIELPLQIDWIEG